MYLEMLSTVVLVGPIVGWLTGTLMKGGGYGLVWDVVLGLGGSVAGSWILLALAAAPEAGRFATVVAAAVGAAIVIVAQRQGWPAQA
jgi:uncharacterized membrane protein YeaQ/YmgE (transglycosylase-associated protein family)